jgi:dsRNA-specific ribonuclease
MDSTFTVFIKKLLQKGRLKEHYINILLSPEAMKVYTMAFTHKSVDKKNNYEFLEQLGDSTLNNFIVWYFYRRFKVLQQPQGVYIINRLKIYYGSKKALPKIAEKYNFWNWVRKNGDVNKNDTEEDIVESFVGATQLLVDKYIKLGVGYAIVYDILETMFDEVFPDISLKYEDLVDSVTRLKEIVDSYQKNTDYKVTQTINYSQVANKIKVTIIFSGGLSLSAEGLGINKTDAHKSAAENMILKLKNKGIFIEKKFEFLNAEVKPLI